MEADGLFVGEYEVCESMEEVVVLVAQERLYLLVRGLQFACIK